MDIEAYLNRINYRGQLQPDLATLNKLIVAHTANTPFENIDQQLAKPVSMETADIFEKLITDKRGGWCFELNTLFAQLLKNIGFDVKLLAGHVGSDGSAQSHPATHMFLMVNCGEPLLVDVGFGGGLNAAIPMRKIQVTQSPYVISIEQVNDGFWRYQEKTGLSSSSFDFKQFSVNLESFAETSTFLQTDQASPFKRTLTAQIRRQNKHIVLRGRLLKTYKTNDVKEHLIADSDELVSCLRATFNLDVPDIKTVWPKILTRHDELFG